MKTVEELVKSAYFCKNEKNTTASEHKHNIELLKEEINDYIYAEWLATHRNIQIALELLEELKKEEITFSNAKYMASWGLNALPYRATQK